MKSYEELPFGIDFVIEQDLAKVEGFKKWRGPRGSYDITCPFCGGKRKFNVNTDLNVARCNKGGSSCVLDGNNGYNTITLHAALTGLSNSESYKDLMKRYGNLSEDDQAKLKIKPLVSKESYLEPASIDVRDKAYRYLLKSLTLSRKHFEDLINRGLSKEEIEEGMYKTVPVIGLNTLAYDAFYNSGAFYDFKARKYGIPGFYDLRDEPQLVKRKNGYFVPVRDRQGRISSMQIRYDNLPNDATQEQKDSYHKYAWYSSSEKDTGCSVSGCENIHFAGKWDKIPKQINLTEGVLKADIASSLSKTPFIGLGGVSNLGGLCFELMQLKDLGTEKINICIDMDYRDKKEVAAALDNIKETIERAGLSWSLITWPETYKGIDDFLLAKKNLKG